MAYNHAGRMTSYAVPEDSTTNELLQGWAYNGLGQLTTHTRADTNTVSFAYDTPTTEYPLRTGHLTSVTWPLSSGSLTTTLGYRTTTGAVDSVSDSTGCMLSTVYETGVASPWEPLPVGQTLGDASGGSCPVQDSVSWTINALFESTTMTVAGGTTVSFTLNIDADRLLTAAGGMTLGRDNDTGRLTGTTIGDVATTRAYTSYGEVASEDATVTSSTELGLAYSYDVQGRLAIITETGHYRRVTGYSYDRAGRLHEVSRSVDDAGVDVIETYNYVAAPSSLYSPTSWWVAMLRTEVFRAADFGAVTVMRGDLPPTCGTAWGRGGRRRARWRWL